MANQNCIGRVLRSPGGMERLGAILAAGGFETRTDLGRLVCSEFGFADPLGRPQAASCAVALRELAAEGRIRIPEPSRRGGGGGTAGPGGEVPPPEGVPGRAGLVGNLRLVPAGGASIGGFWARCWAGSTPKGRSATSAGSFAT